MNEEIRFDVLTRKPDMRALQAKGILNPCVCELCGGVFTEEHPNAGYYDTDAHQVCRDKAKAEVSK